MKNFLGKVFWGRGKFGKFQEINKVVWLRVRIKGNGVSQDEEGVRNQIIQNFVGYVRGLQFYFNSNGNLLKGFKSGG